MQLSGWVALYEIIPHGNPEHDVYMPKYYGHCKKVITVIRNVSYSECGLEGSENKKKTILEPFDPSTVGYAI